MAKFPAQGTVVRYGAAVGTGLPAPGVDTFTAVGQLQSISGPGIAKSQFDVTTFDDLAKTFLSDLPEPGTLEFTIVLDGALTDHVAIFGDAAAQQRQRNWQVELNDQGDLTSNTILNFVAEVLSWSPSFEAGAAVVVEISCQVSGAITPTWRA